MLDELLRYHETPQDDEFNAEVMKRVRHQQRRRRLILSSTGIVGGAFGAAGVLLISDSVSRLIADANVLPASIALVGVAVFLTWLFQDETSMLG